MANTKSARRMIRVAERRRQRNRAIKSAVRTYIKKAEQAIQANVNACHEQVIAAIRALDRAVTKGVLHRNNAARRKSRLMKKYNRAKAAATAAAS
ncbi:MAG TPA: 30S ribosomal protein S20 [Chloroflexota bacterium]|nr:30S ribosomal protein S20 [Chloroflexota bacterium]